jgi:predicted acylesterase/phospholipase RssA
VTRFGHRARRAIVALAIVALATNCSTIRRPPATVGSLETDGQALQASQQAIVDALIDDLVNRAVRRGEHTLDLLLLSGGGQNGAYGAGFLRGWRGRTTDPLPAFDLVTGVSAGAMQSPFAVLGTQAAVDQVGELFRNAAHEFAPTFDWWYWFFHTGGVVKPDRSRQTVERVLDEKMQAALATEFAADRRLLVATTDVDLGRSHLWDFAHELGRTPEGLPRARSILLASAAIPSIFPPVVIDGHVHADGAVISNVLNPLEFRDYQTLAHRLRAKGVTGDVTIRVWVVMNLWLSPSVVVMNPSSRGDMSHRATGLLLSGQQPQLIENLGNLARSVGTIPGLKMRLRSTSIPAVMSKEKGADKLFDDAWMRRLEQFGFDRAVGLTPWDEDASQSGMHRDHGK